MRLTHGRWIGLLVVAAFLALIAVRFAHVEQQLYPRGGEQVILFALGCSSAPALFLGTYFWIVRGIRLWKARILVTLTLFAGSLIYGLGMSRYQPPVDPDRYPRGVQCFFAGSGVSFVISTAVWIVGIGDVSEPL